MLFERKDGVFNKKYYDLLLGQDLSVYPSSFPYEPWGIRLLRLLPSGVPTITTGLAGFGLWVNGLDTCNCINDGVEVLHRTDSNYMEVADSIKIRSQYLLLRPPKKPLK